MTNTTSLARYLPRRHLIFRFIFVFFCFFCRTISEAPIARSESPPITINQNAEIEYTDSGPQITYETTLTNEGSAPLTGVLVTDVIPSEARLLYFSSSNDQNWLSSLRIEKDGQLALWVNQKPLAPGEAAKLTYVVAIPWEGIESPQLNKNFPVARAGGFNEIVPQGIASITFAPTPFPSAVPSVTPTVARAATATFTSPGTVRIASSSTEASNVPTRTVSPTSKPVPSETSPTPMATMTSTASSKGNESTFSTTVLIVALIISITVLIVLWVTIKKR